jgi:hypothetical protein
MLPLAAQCRDTLPSRNSCVRFADNTTTNRGLASSWDEQTFTTEAAHARESFCGLSQPSEALRGGGGQVQAPSVISCFSASCILKTLFIAAWR